MERNKDRLQSAYCNIMEINNIPFLEGIDLSKLLFNEFYYAIDCSLLSSIKLFVSRVVFSFNDYRYQQKEPDVLLFSPVFHRKDYDEYWNNILSILPYSSALSINFHTRQVNSFPTIVSRFFLFWKVFTKLRGIHNLSHRCYLAARLIELAPFKEYLQSIDVHPQVFMCYFDGDLYSNFATQYYKNKGAITLTNQHGQPIFRSFSEDRLNQSQIINLTADYYLSKGNYSIKQFSRAGYSSEKIIKIGLLCDINDFTIKQGYRNVFGLFLDCPLLPFSKETNIELLKEAEKLYELTSIKYVLKLHPLDSKESYANLKLKGCVEIIGREKSISEISQDIDFALICASAVYLDLIGFGIHTYKLEKGPFFPIVDNENDLVLNAEDLIAKNREWECLTIDEKKKEMIARRNEYYSPDPEGNSLKMFLKKIMCAC